MPESEMILFTSFSREGEKGLSVAKMRELKKELKKLGAKYVVAKKNLIRISTEQSGLGEKVKVDDFEGSVGLVLGEKGTDGIALSKNVYEFAKVNPVFKVLGGIFENQYLDPAGFTVLAKLPTKNALIGQLVGMLIYPIRGLAVVLSEIGKKKEVTA